MQQDNVGLHDKKKLSYLFPHMKNIFERKKNLKGCLVITFNSLLPLELESVIIPSQLHPILH